MTWQLSATSSPGLGPGEEKTAVGPLTTKEHACIHAQPMDTDSSELEVWGGGAGGGAG